jgi:hypothetical protein
VANAPLLFGPVVPDRMDPHDAAVDAELEESATTQPWALLDKWDSWPIGSCRSWRAAYSFLILVRTGDSVSSAMRLTTFLTTIGVCPLKSANVQNRYM